MSIVFAPPPTTLGAGVLKSAQRAEIGGTSQPSSTLFPGIIAVGDCALPV